MDKNNLEKYFNEDYYDSTYLVKILEDLLGKSFNEIRKDINNKKIIANSEEIEFYLKERFMYEKPDLYERLQKPKTKLGPDASKWTDEAIRNYSERIADEYEAKRYSFDPFTLEYYQKYTEIVRNKINKLLDIVNGLATKEIKPIKKDLNKLDIKISKDGKISKEDIIRLIVPLITNIEKLKEKVDKANNLSTYISFKLSKDSLYREGFFESELYPQSDLQTQSDMNDWKDDNVKLSDNQRKILKKHQDKNRKRIADFITGMNL